MIYRQLLAVILTSYLCDSSVTSTEEIVIAPPEVPPEVLKFRLQSMNNWNKDKCLIRNINDWPNVDRDTCGNNTPQMYWSIIDVDADNRWFKLKNAEGFCLYEDNGNTQVGGCTNGINNFGLDAFLWRYDDIQSDQSEKSFRLKNKGSLDCLSANDNGNTVKSETCNDNQDRYWFVRDIEGFEIYDIYFDTNDAFTDQATNPLAIGGDECDNDNGGQGEISISFTASREITATSFFQHSAGFSISRGFEVTVGVPDTASGTASQTLTLSWSYTWGESRSATTKIERGVTVTCMPGEHMYYQIEAYIDTLNVPYTVIWKSIDNDYTFYSNGVWKNQITTRVNTASYPL